MPAPSSPIHSSLDMLTVAFPAAFTTKIPEADFLTCFPRPFKVQALDVYAAGRLSFPTDRTFWLYLEDFEYVSPAFGSIVIPKGSYTDFASVPPFLRSLYDDDSPILLYPSAPHDFLFTKRASDGTRGWISPGRQLSLREVNKVLTEAMEKCGANSLQRDQVFVAVEAANQGIRHEFRP